MNLPDVNVWVSLALQNHPHSIATQQWLQELSPRDQIFFCRQSQLGLLRLLTTRTIPGGPALTQTEAWLVYDGFLSDLRVSFLDEPAGLPASFRSISDRDEASPKRWADDYLSAFAQTANLTLVTFDKALAARTPGSLQLKS